MEDTQKEYLDTLAEIRTTSEKMQQRFAEGTPQHSLMKNRAHAVSIAEACILQAGTVQFSVEELTDALPQLKSVEEKSSKAIEKFKIYHGHYYRLKNMIESVAYAQACITGEIERLSGAAK